MIKYDNCPNCFMPIGAGTVCSHCGNDYSKNKMYSGVLPAFSLINNRYLVGRVLGKGGFGVTYIAKDIVSNNIYAIKEYMPSEYSTRCNGTQNIVPFSDNRARSIFIHGREKFVKEAGTLLKLSNNPTVVDILDYFEQNNTAYIVMEYLDGQNLRELARNSGGKIDSDFMKNVFVTVASSLMEIHRKKILHRDLSPENIIYTNDGRIKLIDFGAARSYVITQNKGMSILLKPGFAPPEQYDSQGNQGPWSDVYALCATFYTLVSGKPLVDALFRYRGEQQPSLISMGCPVTKKTSDVIERGMQLDIKHRYQDFKELLDDIDINAAREPAKKPPTTNVSCESNRNSPKTTSSMQFYIAAVVGNSLCNKAFIGHSDVFKIGRSSQSCQYVVSGDTNISRIHCYLRFDGRKLYLCDASVNGTFLEDGTQLVKNKEYEVVPGTRFYLATRNHMLVIGV